MKSRRISTTLSVAAIAALALTACGSSDEPSTPAEGGDAAAGEISLVSDGKLTVCTHLSYRPFQFKEADGSVVGFDVDLMDLVADELGVEQEILDIEFAQITSGAVFAAGRCDAAAAATTITEERQNAILFSDPYFEATQALIVRKDAGIASLADMDGKGLGVQSDTTGQIFAEGQQEENSYGYEIVIFDDLVTQLNGLKADRVQGALNDNGVLFDFAKDNPETEVVEEFATGEQYGFMAQKDNANATALMEKINEVLAAAKEDGRFNEIYNTWFGTDAPS